MSNQDTYEQVTERIVEGLEKVDSGDWEAPWDRTLGMPSNRKTGNLYSGINVLLLWFAQQAEEYEHAQWLTYRQAQKLDGHVRKGETGTKIAFFKIWNKKTVVDDNGDDVDVEPDDVDEETFDEKGWEIKTQRLPLWKTYTVFNVEQCEGVEPQEVESHGEPRRDEFENFIQRIGADIEHGHPRACYDHQADEVRLPTFEAFDSAEGYYKTLAHELTHWTGHESRLDREFGDRFGDDAYAFEELVAELGSAFLGTKFNIGDGEIKNPARYVKHWIEMLQEDEYAIFLASSKAKEAVEYLEESAKMRQAAE